MEMLWGLAIVGCAIPFGIAGWVLFVWLPTLWRKRNEQ